MATAKRAVKLDLFAIFGQVLDQAGVFDLRYETVRKRTTFHHSIHEEAFDYSVYLASLEVLLTQWA